MTQPADSAGATPVAGGATPSQTPPATTPAAETTPAAQAASATEAPEGLGDPGKRALDAMKAERKAALDRAKVAEDELEKVKTANQSESDKALAAAKKTGETETASKFEGRIRRSEVKAGLLAAGINQQFLDLAARADQFAALTVDDDGAVEGLEDAIRAFRAATPDAFKAAGTAGPSGSADGGVRGGQTKQLTKDQLKKMTPAEINAEFDKPGQGGLAGLLKPGG